ncbi:MAG: hypothetical protein ACYDCP_04640 [Thermoplasmataceae archaeon]|jgi:hypothetical protein
MGDDIYLEEKDMDGNNFVLYPNVEREMNGQTICACYKHELVFAATPQILKKKADSKNV